jgi:hypothetical protein
MAPSARTKSARAAATRPNAQLRRSVLTLADGKRMLDRASETSEKVADFRTGLLLVIFH